VPRKRKRVTKFSRAILPPSRFHTTKKGARGFLRRRDRPGRSQTRDRIWRDWGV